MSTTSTVKVPCPVLPAASVAEHVTVVSPSAYEVGVHGAEREPSTSSVAVPLKAWVAPADEVA